MPQSQIHFTQESPDFGGSVRVQNEASDIVARVRAARAHSLPFIEVKRQGRPLFIATDLIGIIQVERTREV